MLSLKELLEKDQYRWGDEENLMFIPQYKFITIKRKCEYWRDHNKVLFLLYRLKYEKYKVKYNTDIPAGIKIGYGFKIRHLGGIVINPNVVIGCNVDILNGVLLGQLDRGDKKGSPTIGNKVFIGTNAIVVGNIIIEDDVVIAPGAYVNFNVPSHSIVIGNPGKIIHKKNATDDQLQCLVQ